MEQYERLEKRVEKIEDKQTIMLQELATFKPILEVLSDNVKKISENNIEKSRVERIESKLEMLENELVNETSKKKAKLLEEIIKSVILALVGIALGYFIK